MVAEGIAKWQLLTCIQRPRDSSDPTLGASRSGAPAPSFCTHLGWIFSHCLF